LVAFRFFKHTKFRFELGVFRKAVRKFRMFGTAFRLEKCNTKQQYR
jgi:hypothetical protein